MEEAKQGSGRRGLLGFPPLLTAKHSRQEGGKNATSALDSFVLESPELVDDESNEKRVKEARALLSSSDAGHNQAALGLLEAAIALCPRWDTPFQLKATALLRLRRYRDVVDLLRDDLPEDSPLSSSASNSTSSVSDSVSRESENLLKPASPADSTTPTATKNAAETLTRCLFVGILARNGDNGRDTHRQHWRYIVLGQALSHLGLLKDSLLLLQAGKRLASASFRRESVLLSDDLFANSDSSEEEESETVPQLIANVKFLLRRRTAALAALDADVPAEAIRHFSKILDASRRPVPQAFLAECYMHRGAAYRATGRLADSIADCNRTLALDPTCVGALSTRAALFERILCFAECLQDLEHLKLLYDSILRDRRVPGSAWRRPGGHCGASEAASGSREVAAKIAKLKEMVVSGEVSSVDYYTLMGLRRGCMRSELECTHRLLCLRHRPDRATGFIDRCEFVDDRDVDRVRDQARMSGALLYRLLRKAYAHVMTNVLEEEAAAANKRKQGTTVSVATGTAGVKPLLPISPTSPILPELRKDGYNSDMKNCASRDNQKKGEFELEKPTPVATLPCGFRHETVGSGGLHSPGFVHPVHHLHQALSC